jgi:hypothetical protein
LSLKAIAGHHGGVLLPHRQAVAFEGKGIGQDDASEAHEGRRDVDIGVAICSKSEGLCAGPRRGAWDAEACMIQ